MAEQAVTEEELNTDSSTNKEFLRYKADLVDKIGSMINDVSSIGIRSELKNRMVTELTNIIMLLNSDISKYEEQGLLESTKRNMDDIYSIMFDEPTDEMVQKLFSRLSETKLFIKNYGDLKREFENLSLNALKPVIEEVNQELSKFRRLKNLADNARTEDFYDKAVEKYRKLENNYRLSFFIGLGIIIAISIVSFLFKKYLLEKYLGESEFWAIKISILLGGITLISYFLKQSSHYQRLADQNEQIQLELQAYPSFMESIPTEEAASVRKELALKYFGREIDAAAHKDMSNLISDQMKSTTDMVKATTEAIKNIRG
ncbi:hypothetical protein ACSNOU_14770 [Acinetobacter oleivorans]|uniref:hypothetical protein n=1 Tax=Acinetobacter oleivorans TaxID=1148157 RepID=UPI003F1CCDC3